ncbi:unnamed protein product [Caenorhabditis auriculariae]|uniref:Alpha-galactosidase n=1 Tax=Caenorhabditis auriculariae TaxID=2777116 RepID=A0A8S1GTU4_9PELO|nr:unnamed protein product [Caenorhabditis auriculariae]
MQIRWKRGGDVCPLQKKNDDVFPLWNQNDDVSFRKKSRRSSEDVPRIQGPRRPLFLSPRPLICMLFSALLVVFLGFAQSLENGLARKPPMGWMSWAAFYCETDCDQHPRSCISELLYGDMADRLASEGYREAGYVGVHVDDCWMERQRDRSGALVPDRTRFPSGLKSLADYIHDKGLKFGLYEDYGTKTCEGYPGSYGHLKIDAQSFANWTVDYLKLDGCNIDVNLMEKGFPEMQVELNATGRQIVYSCVWPLYLLPKHSEKIDYKYIGDHCNLWRNFDDVKSSWDSITSIIDYYDRNQEKHIPTHGPGRWHDPDMLVIGNENIDVNMATAQMTIWSIWSAPLMISTDLRTIKPEFKKILLNKDVIAVDQDKMGIMGRMIANSSNVFIYLKPISPTADLRSSFAFALLNRNTTHPFSAEFDLESVGLEDAGGYKVTNLWSGEEHGRLLPSDTINMTIPASGAVMFRAVLVDLKPKHHKIDRFLKSGQLLQLRSATTLRKTGKSLCREIPEICRHSEAFVDRVFENITTVTHTSTLTKQVYSYTSEEEPKFENGPSYRVLIRNDKFFDKFLTTLNWHDLGVTKKGEFKLRDVCSNKRLGRIISSDPFDVNVLFFSFNLYELERIPGKAAPVEVPITNDTVVEGSGEINDEVNDEDYLLTYLE